MQWNAEGECTLLPWLRRQLAHTAVVLISMSTPHNYVFKRVFHPSYKFVKPHPSDLYHFAVWKTWAGDYCTTDEIECQTHDRHLQLFCMDCNGRFDKMIITFTVINTSFDTRNVRKCVNKIYIQFIYERTVKVFQFPLKKSFRLTVFFLIFMLIFSVSFQTSPKANIHKVTPKPTTKTVSLLQKRPNVFFLFIFLHFLLWRPK